MNMTPSLYWYLVRAATLDRIAHQSAGNAPEPYTSPEPYNPNVPTPLDEYDF